MDKEFNGNSNAVRKVMEINIKRRRGRGKSKKKWLDAIGYDMRTVGVYV